MGRKRERNLIAYSVGDDVLVFDPILWAGRDRGTTNAQCYKPATIVRLYKNAKEWLADVRFHYDDRISHGHFVSGIRFLEKEVT